MMSVYIVPHVLHAVTIIGLHLRKLHHYQFIGLSFLVFEHGNEVFGKELSQVLVNLKQANDLFLCLYLARQFLLEGLGLLIASRVEHGLGCGCLCWSHLVQRLICHSYCFHQFAPLLFK